MLTFRKHRASKKRQNGRTILSKKMRSKAFTLIELLVVIAIIALLLSIIMPALKRVKEAGKRTQCLANVKSLTIG